MSAEWLNQFALTLGTLIAAFVVQTWVQYRRVRVSETKSEAHVQAVQASVTSNQTALLQRMDELNGKVQAAQQEIISDLRDRVNRLEEARSQTDTRNAELQKTVDKFKELTDAQATRISEQSLKIHAEAKRINELQDSLVALQRDNSETVVRYQHLITGQGETIKAKDAEIASLMMQLEAQLAEVATLKTQIADLTTRLANLEETVKLLQADLEKERGENEVLRNRLTSVTVERDELKRKVEDLKSERDQLMVENETLKHRPVPLPTSELTDQPSVPPPHASEGGA